MRAESIRKSRTVTEKQKERIRALMKEGLTSWSGIAKAVKLCPKTIQKIAKEEGIPYLFVYKHKGSPGEHTKPVRRAKGALRHANGFPVMYQDADARDNQVKAMFTGARV